jgi:hypothetical protein
MYGVIPQKATICVFVAPVSYSSTVRRRSAVCVSTLSYDDVLSTDVLMDPESTFSTSFIDSADTATGRNR